MVKESKDMFKFKYSPFAAILGYATSLGKTKKRKIESLNDLK
jgi:hypothetical protein